MEFGNFPNCADYDTNKPTNDEKTKTKDNMSEL